ncbi:SE-domain-containing protein [Nadsonia fulvescens var. elongata DSM 6958]|uniref:Squalene monooxygenase n=1 Tax=Nadsonia fulvescens var. elongata DSM 6958 TaxID=857566 RepID=A0A1E3PSS0_9ASCO|nr:SE-domain-containing protein [Nadsonia fulvescens var. elongata DSM 6958]
MSGTESPKLSREYDVVIIGAGVVGPTLAVQLAKQGRKVLIVERDLAEPDRIVGELLQPGGLKTLKKLGFGAAVEGIDAVKVAGYEVIFNKKSTHIPYPLIDKASPNGPREEGISFHHGRFIMKLRQIARETENITILEATVSELIRNPNTDNVIGVKVKDTKTGQSSHYFAPLTVVSDGTFSKFRKEAHTKPVKISSHFVGIELTDPVMPRKYHGHVIVGDHAPVLIYQIGTHETRILCDIQGPMPSSANGDLKAHLVKTVLPNLPESVKPSFEKAIESQRLRTMPNSFLPPYVNNTPGMILLGDALNMRHPLTGGGMTVAFNDVLLISELLHPKLVPSLKDYTLIAHQLKTFHWQRKNLGSVVNILAQALYSLFGADTADLKVLQSGCFKYFELGGECVNGPVSLLSGLLPKPVVLFNHFFAVAFYAVYANFKEKGLNGFFTAFIQAFTALYAACVVIFPYIIEEMKWY